MPKILVVDDDYAFAEFSKMLLERSGYEVVVTLSGAAALGLAIAEKPDLILMDLFMKEVNGIQAVRMLKAEPATRDIPVIFCSISKSQESAAEVMSAGAADFLPKPLKREELTRRIQEVIGAAGS